MFVRLVEPSASSRFPHSADHAHCGFGTKRMKTATDAPSGIAQTIIDLERQALERWGKGDPFGFQAHWSLTQPEGADA
jgi:hypothetical protein